jgi:hypothetical protein
MIKFVTSILRQINSISKKNLSKKMVISSTGKTSAKNSTFTSHFKQSIFLSII